MTMEAFTRMHMGSEINKLKAMPNEMFSQLHEVGSSKSANPSMQNGPVNYQEK